MMFQRFSGDLRRAISEARRLATRGQGVIRVDHILIGLLTVEGSVAASALRELGIDPSAVCKRMQERVVGLELTIDSAPTYEGGFSFDLSAMAALEWALAESHDASMAHVGTGHALVGLLRTADVLIEETLGEFQVTLDAVLPLIGQLEGQEKATCSPILPPSSVRSNQESKIALTPCVAEFIMPLLERAVRMSQAERPGAIVGEEYVLLAMLERGERGSQVLRQCGVTTERVREIVGQLGGGGI